jgi:hypothetical protein
MQDIYTCMYIIHVSQLCSNFYLHNNNPRKIGYQMTCKVRRLVFQSYKLRVEYQLYDWF